MSSVVDHQPQHNVLLSPPPSANLANPPPPTLLTLDFATNPVLRQVTTLLRRVWLLDPPLADEELADPATVGPCLQAVTQLVGAEFSFSSSPDKKEEDDDDTNKTMKGEDDDNDDEAWKSRTQFRLLAHPVVISADKEATARQQQQKQGGGGSAENDNDNDNYYVKSVVSPWREEIYDVYRHVFADFWRMAVAVLSARSSTAAAGGTSTQQQMGVFEPTRGDAVSVAALPAPSSPTAEKNINNTTKTSFKTDTFLYPVWVSPQARVTFSAAATGERQEEEEKHCWVAGADKTFTTGLWVKAGQEIVLRTERIGGEEDEGTGLAAVFVTGHCVERKD